MKKPCVLIMRRDSLWSRVLEGPGIRPDLEIKLVIGETTTVQDLLKEIYLYDVDLVLISESMPPAQKENLAELLMVCPKLRVIVASEDSNWVHIFRKEDVLLGHLNDLLDLINSAD
jgi:hypothetical protein